MLRHGNLKVKGKRQVSRVNDPEFVTLKPSCHLLSKAKTMNRRSASSERHQTLGDLSEDELIQRFIRPVSGDLNDDCASLMVPPGNELLVSSDALLEEVHFLRKSPAPWVGRKAVAANLSDIVASGGQPRWLTLSLGLPKSLEINWVEGFLSGFAQTMSETGTQLIGGDTTRSMDRIAISVTVMGLVSPQNRITRTGARLGDLIGVTGTLGEAQPGLAAILGERHLTSKSAAYWIERHFSPPYLGGFGRSVAATGWIHAMMDLSDGLSVDLPRLCNASGVGAQILCDQIPLSESARQLGMTWEDAWAAGEDYQLLFAVAPENWEACAVLARSHEVEITAVGRFESQLGIRLQGPDGTPVVPRTSAWVHF